MIYLFFWKGQDTIGMWLDFKMVKGYNEEQQ